MCAAAPICIFDNAASFSLSVVFLIMDILPLHVELFFLSAVYKGKTECRGAWLKKKKFDWFGHSRTVSLHVGTNT